VAPSFGPDPGEAMGSERRSAVWARRAVWVQGIWLCVLPLAYTLVFHSFFKGIENNIDHPNSTATFPATGGWIVVLDLASLVVLAAVIMMIIWSYQAASHARALHYPASLGVIWAVLGWLIPIVNFWFPYQVLRDCLPATEAAGRRLVLRWWLLYIFGSLVFAAAGIAGAFAPVVGFVAAAVGLAWGTWQATTGIKMVDAIQADHERATAAITGGLDR
jgi:hypothetical protein